MRAVFSLKEIFDPRCDFFAENNMYLAQADRLKAFRLKAEG